MDNSANTNKNVLLVVGALVGVLVGLGVVLFMRQNSAPAATTNGSFSMPAGTPGRAVGYKGAELMPAAPGAANSAAGTAANPAPVGHATGYQGANLMPAPPGGAAAAGGAAAPANSAPAHASGYQGANLMPAPPAGR